MPAESRPAFKEPGPDLWLHYSAPVRGHLRLGPPAEKATTETLPIRQKIWSPELKEITRSVTQTSSEKKADISALDLLEGALKPIPFYRGEEWRRLLFGLYAGDRSAFAAISERIRDSNRADALAWLVKDEGLSCYVVAHSGGLDDVTRQNLYFSNNDVYLQAEEDLEWLNFHSRLRHDPDFTRRFSTRFLNRFSGMLNATIPGMAGKARLLLFYRNEVDKDQVQIPVEDLLPWLQNIYEQNCLRSSYDQEGQAMYLELQEFRRGHEEFTVIHQRVDPESPERATALIPLLASDERLIRRSPGLFTWVVGEKTGSRLLPELKKIAAVKNVTLHYPRNGENLLCYLSDWY
ncbi:MAG: hypothetical protein HS115_08330 [Spirochaetales bacterium]|nr:hypothetical protein [Spirochaetales bacterium]